MGSHSRQKGNRREREAAQLVRGVRTWQHLHDILGDDGRWWEVKGEATGYAKVYNALEEHTGHYEETGDGPVPSALIKQDRKPWIVIFYASDWLEGRANADARAESQD